MLSHPYILTVDLAPSCNSKTCLSFSSSYQICLWLAKSMCNWCFLQQINFVAKKNHLMFPICNIIFKIWTMQIFILQSIESTIECTENTLVCSTNNVYHKKTNEGWIATVINSVNQFKPEQIYKPSSLARSFRQV